VPEAREAAAALTRALKRRKKGTREVIAISAVTGEGMQELLDAVGSAIYPETTARQRGGAGKRLGKRRSAP
jgi:GTP-binding protein